MSAFDELAGPDVDLLTDDELVPRRVLAEAVEIGESALAEARYLRGEHPGKFWWEPWCEDHPGDHPGDPKCFSCLGASHDAWMHRAKAAEARVAELEAVLRDATKFIDYPGRFDGVERLALASRCRLVLKGKSAS